MKDKLGNFYEEPKAVRPPEPCDIQGCPQNSFDATGFVCSLSIFDHEDCIRPSGCFHRAWKLKGRENETV